MKIVRVITRLNIGGPARQAVLLTARLNRSGVPSVLIAGQPESGEGDFGVVADAQHVSRVSIRELRRSLHPWRDAIALMKLCRLLWRERPTIIHTHMAKAGTLGRLAGLIYNRVGPGRRRGARALLIHTFHGHVLEGYFSSWLARVFLRIERWLAARTDCLIAVSPAIRDELLKKGIGRPEQWRVVLLGLDLSALAGLPVPTDVAPMRIGLIGRLVPIKNPSLFVSAFDQLRRRTSPMPVEGRVVGDGPLRPSLEQEAKRLGLEPLIQFTGWQHDLRAVYQQLEATCLTSWNEGTPVAMIEAMAAGRAVVATDVGGVRNVLEDAEQPLPIPRGGFRATERGLLVRPGDSDGLAAALTALAEDSTLRTRLGAAARAYVVQRFSEERLCRDITALYASLITSEGGGT